ncbi:MAG: alpha/beta hydrolase [Solirubrobacterales bacterium]|nr:alpha/beta hydrolase [Solirubrobacterales bacterium]
MPGHSQGTFEGEGGPEIWWQSWSPDGTAARATVVIAHGVSEHSGRYAHVAARLVGEGYAVYALDHRGHGRSDGRRACVDRVARAVADIGTLIGIARAEQSGAKLFLLGHSMGGALALQYAIDRQDSIDGLILSAPAAALEAASQVQLIAGRVLSVVAPTVGVFDVDAAGVSRDPEVVRAYVDDPLVHNGKLPARTVAELASAIQGFERGARTLRLPLLVMLGTADTLVPPDAGRMVEREAGSADKTLIEYEGLYHEILNEPEQDRVMDDLVAWLDAH